MENQLLTGKKSLPQINQKELYEILEILDKMENPPALMVYGPPGIGKTEIIKQFTENKNYDLRVKHLSRMDQTDWTGLPDVDQSGYTVFKPIGIFREKEENKAKIVIFFDEINTADPRVLNAALDVILEKKGDTDSIIDKEKVILNKNTLIIAAGNLGEEIDGTYTEEFSSAVKTRLIQVKIIAEKEPWLCWAENRKKNGEHCPLNNIVINFIKKNSIDFLLDLNGFKENHDQIATPRGWERVSELIDIIFGKDKKPNPDDSDKWKIFCKLVIGTVGKLKGSDFLYFCEMLKSEDKKLIEKFSEWLKKLKYAERIYTNEAELTVENLKKLVEVVSSGLSMKFDSTEPKEAAKRLSDFLENKVNKNIIKKGIFAGIMENNKFFEYLKNENKTEILSHITIS